MPSVNCFKLAAHAIRRALDFAPASAGSNKAAKMAIMAMTTSNSIKVKADLPLIDLGHWDGIIL